MPASRATPPRAAWPGSTGRWPTTPQAAIVELGGNRRLRGLPPAQSRANLAAILDRLQARGIPVLLAGCWRRRISAPNAPQQFAAIFAELAAARPEVVFYPFFLEGWRAMPR